MEVSVHDEIMQDTVRDDQSADTADIETLTVAASPRALVAVGVCDAVQQCSATSLLSVDTVPASGSVLALEGRDMFPQATVEDVAHNRSQIIQPAPPSVLRHLGWAGNHASVEGVASNRFFSLGTDSDDEQIAARSCSDTDSVPTRP